MRISTAVILILILLNSESMRSQNCSVTSTGRPPISDLGINFYRGFQGGLYPNGYNNRPSDHNSDGIEIANNIIPLDTNGNFDPVNGKIVFISVGMSNCNLEFAQFMQIVNGAPYLNPQIVIVNCAQGGYDINLMLDSASDYWDIVNQKLSWKGITMKQVQAVWYKNVELGPTDTTFPGYPNSLKSKHVMFMNIMNDKFSNLKLCYFASRIYAGYAISGGNREPFANYSGWAGKWLIEDQINGNSNLIYKGISKNSPWISWGPYLWADGSTPNSDGLIWTCPTDYQSDGTHPSTTGSIKVANKLVSFFTTDETSKPWFLKNITLDLNCALEGMLNTGNNSLNLKDTVIVYLHSISSPYSKIDSSVAVIDTITLAGKFNFYNTVNGTYYISVHSRNGIETWSKSGGEVLNNSSPLSLDFTASPVTAFGNNMILKGTKYCFFSGDTDQDGVIDLTDVSLIENDAENFTSGYLFTDLTGDLITDISDSQIADNNSFNFISKISP